LEEKTQEIRERGKFDGMYIENVLEQFSMQKAKSITSSLVCH
jgi:hypothetical protein